MMMAFPSLQVAGLNLEIFRDHLDPAQFYVLRSMPKIATNQEGDPMLNYMMIERNADIAYASSKNKEIVEAQLGQLQLTVDLGITPDEYDVISQHLTEILKQEQHNFVRFYNLLTKRNFEPEIPEPKITTQFKWKKANAKFSILEFEGDTFKKSSNREVKPSMVGSNSASFYATFGVEGSQIIYDALSKGYQEEDGEEEEEKTITPIGAIVEYNTTLMAMVPNLEIKVKGTSTEIFDYLKTQWEAFSKKYDTETRTYKRSYLWGAIKKEYKYKVRTGVSAAKSDVRNMVQTMIDKKVIDVQISDFSALGAKGSEAEELTNALKNMIIDMVMNVIIPRFFENGLVATDYLPGETEGEEGENTGDSNLDMLSPYDKYKERSTQTYYFSESIDVTKVTDISFHFRENKIIEMEANPQGTLTIQLTEEERKSLIKHVSVADPIVQILPVNVSVNADFEEDDIYAVTVQLNYDHTDSRTGIKRKHRKAYEYKTGSEKNTFRVTMARDENGALIDTYDAVAKIHYKGTAESPPAIEFKNISDRALIISYDRLNFITVDLALGEVDWSVIKEVEVQLEYLEEPNKPDTSKAIRLNKDNPIGSWKCYTYGHENKKYRYRVKYFNNDGTESFTEYTESTKDSLTIDDNLTGRINASFDVLLDRNSVEAVKLEIAYEDEAHNLKQEYSHWFTSTDSWDWKIRLQNGATSDFKYRYVVQYSDGMVTTTDWAEAGSDEDIPTFNVRRFNKSLDIDGGFIDWSKYRVVYLNVKYRDEANNYEKGAVIRLTESNFLQRFEALGFSYGHNVFEYDARFASTDGIVSTPVQEVNGGFLILEPPANGNG